MGEHEVNAICAEKFRALKEQVDNHVSEAPLFRDKATKAEAQILTLEKAQEATMQDIRDIKQELKDIKIWILSAAVAGLLVLVGEALYFGGVLKQVDVNTNSLKTLEEMHPRVSK